ncbi:MAG: VOC family protein [Sedimentisphaerales bacterium]|nr:VOC family protein [Sedimentisphaerales bacterium]
MTTKLMRNMSLAVIIISMGLFASGCSDLMKGNKVKQASFEHVAINVTDPVAMADWYCENLGMKIMLKSGTTRFVSDADENMMFELYNNADVTIPDYASQDKLVLHFAFNVDDIDETCEKLVQAGAKWDQEVTTTDSGDKIAVLRDPWGVAIQFVKRAKPMI